MDGIISSVLNKNKEYEFLVTKYDPVFEPMIDAIAVVKEFIINHGLIIYGGSGMDYALRLRGDKIYPDDMLAVPDLDFYSPDSVKHAYELADTLYKHGFKSTRAIVAAHTETMRVDLVDNHFIADITYRPEDVFNNIPTLIYNGMKIIHPDFQRIDLHSSLSFPYDNPPQEVIFARWSKDIKRFNKLNEKYPINASGDVLPLRDMKVPLKFARYVLCGFAAYAVLYNEFVISMDKFSKDMPKGIQPANFTVGDDILFSTLNQTLDVVHFNPAKMIGEISSVGASDVDVNVNNTVNTDNNADSSKVGSNDKTIRAFETYMHIIPERAECTMPFGQLNIYSTKNRLLSVNSVTNGIKFRIVNIQYLLRYFLSMYFMNKNSPKLANTYLSRYTSLLTMITAYENALVSHGGSVETAMESPFFPTIKTYGDQNISISREVILNRVLVDLGEAVPFKIPPNYYPERSIPKSRPHPDVDVCDIRFFHMSGREIPIEDLK